MYACCKKYQNFPIVLRQKFKGNRQVSTGNLKEMEISISTLRNYGAYVFFPKIFPKKCGEISSFFAYKIILLWMVYHTFSHHFSPSHCQKRIQIGFERNDITSLKRIRGCPIVFLPLISFAHARKWRHGDQIGHKFQIYWKISLVDLMLPKITGRSTLIAKLSRELKVDLHLR